MYMGYADTSRCLKYDYITSLYLYCPSCRSRLVRLLVPAFFDRITSARSTCPFPQVTPYQKRILQPNRQQATSSSQHPAHPLFQRHHSDTRGVSLAASPIRRFAPLRVRALQRRVKGYWKSSTGCCSSCRGCFIMAQERRRTWRMMTKTACGMDRRGRCS